MEPESVLTPHVPVPLASTTPPDGISASSRGLLEQIAGEAIAGTVLSRLQADLGAIQRRLEGFERNTNQLNVAFGEFKVKTVEPLREELKFLRYNLGDKQNQSITNLDVLVRQLERALKAMLLASGLSPQKVLEYLEGHGIAPDAPRLTELELTQALGEAEKHIERQKAALDAQETIVAQLEEQVRLLQSPPTKPRKRPRKAKRRG